MPQGTWVSLSGFPVSPSAKSSDPGNTSSQDEVFVHSSFSEEQSWYRGTLAPVCLGDLSNIIMGMNKALKAILHLCSFFFNHYHRTWAAWWWWCSGWSYCLTTRVWSWALVTVHFHLFFPCLCGFCIYSTFLLPTKTCWELNWRCEWG